MPLPHSSEQPTWLWDYEPSYSLLGVLLEGKTANCSTPERGVFAREVLRAVVLERFSEPLEIMVVGAGRISGYIENSFEVPNIAAGLEAWNRDYNLQVVDIQSEPLHCLLGQRCLFMEASKSYYLEAWEEYCSLTHQKPDRNGNNHDGLYWDDYQRYKDYIDGGGMYYVADIPLGLAGKIGRREVVTTEADIAEKCPCEPGSKHLITCCEVLRMLNIPGQQRAIYHMALALMPGGVLVLSKSSTCPVMVHTGGGWLTEEHLRDLGLEEIEWGRDDYTVLQKLGA